MNLRTFQNRKLIIIPIIIFILFIVLAIALSKRSPLENLQIHDHVEYNVDEQWAARLPLKNPNYFVEYNFGTGKIEATIYKYPSFSLTGDMEVEQAKKEITAALTQIGADLSKVEVEWIIK